MWYIFIMNKIHKLWAKIGGAITILLSAFAGWELTSKATNNSWGKTAGSVVATNIAFHTLKTLSTSRTIAEETKGESNHSPKETHVETLMKEKEVASSFYHNI